ncbi:MAG: coiled-coil domain-containing protein [Candidatus Binatia bacterium]
MPAIAFNTLAFAKKLQEGGFTPQQAEVLAYAQAELLEQNLATKLDLKEVEANLRRDMKELETNLRRDMKEIEANLRREIKELERTMKEIEAGLRRDMKDLEYRMLIKLGSLMVVGITAVATLVKLH